MPKRTRTHEIEEFSRGRLRDFFGQLGWVVWDLHPDYGEDLLVRVFAEGNATHYSFFVQAKATDHIDRYLDKEGKYLSFPIDVEHLQHWERFWEPVILTVWDAVSDITYWEIVQDYLEDNDWDSFRKKIRVNIPITNVLDDEGLIAIFERTLTRFQRFESTCEGVNALINYMEKYFHVSVIYQPGARQILIVRSSETAKLDAEKMNAVMLDQEAFFPEISTMQGSLFLSTPFGADFILLREMTEWLNRDAEIAKMTLPEFLNYFFKMKIHNSLETSSDHS